VARTETRGPNYQTMTTISHSDAAQASGAAAVPPGATGDVGDHAGGAPEAITSMDAGAPEAGALTSRDPNRESERPPVVRPRPVERHVVVGPLLVSSCLCPRCGGLFAHGGLLQPGEPDPACPRCIYATAWPTAPAELLEVMAELRQRLQDYHRARSLGEGSRVEEHRTFVLVSDAFWAHGPVLLGELERIYGRQGQGSSVGVSNDALGSAVVQDYVVQTR